MKKHLTERDFDKFYLILRFTQFFKVKILKNFSFVDELELVAKKKINRPKWTTTKSATNKTQSFSEFFKRKDTTHMFLTKDLIHLICKRLA